MEIVFRNRLKETNNKYRRSGLYGYNPLPDMVLDLGGGGNTLLSANHTVIM